MGEVNQALNGMKLLSPESAAEITVKTLADNAVDAFQLDNCF